MTPERWQEISRLYHAAAQCEAVERAAFLDQVCADDVALRRELESLLADGSRIEPLVGGSFATVAPFVGRTLGAYEIAALIGAGGMGEVYRARDTRLHRDVALKMLPPLSALGPASARFRREAQLLASLDHPNIARIYGMEEAAVDSGHPVSALVLEYVEGQTLADRIANGPLPLQDALAIARQIVDALQAAHDKGIVHRDLKPANITVRRDGTVKVLDFGLAKTLVPGTVATSGDSMLTARGVVLGTIAYMAPEQARGKESDKRADVWSFGVVLYEMLTGRSPFAGDSVADTVGAVLHTEPDWTRVPATLQPLLQSCLEKDPARRLQDIAGARLWLDHKPRTAARTGRRALLGAAAAIAASLLVAVGIWVAYLRTAPPDLRPVRFQVLPPAEHAFGEFFVLSPNGRYLAYQAYGRGEVSIWVHSLESGEAHPLPRAGDVSMSSIFWSPDSGFIGFVSTDGKLKKVDIAGGPSQVICDLLGNWGGASWSPEGVIVFGRRTGSLMRVSAQGGMPSPLTALSRNEVGHGGPRFLPDGRHFVYHRDAGDSSRSGLYVGSIDAEPNAQGSERLLATTSRPIYAPSDDPNHGFLILVSDGALLSYPFDARKRVIAGEPVRIADNVSVAVSGNITISQVTASESGALAFRSSETASRLPVWVDRSGRELQSLTPAPLDRARSPRISPDGRRVALITAGDVWVHDVAGRPPIRLTFGTTAHSPVWTADGRRIVFLDDDTGVVSVSADGSSAPAEPAGPKGRFFPFDWTPAGQILAAAFVAGSEADVVQFAPEAGATPQPVVRSPAIEGVNGLALSPDGRWLAYSSNATGREEIWIQSYPGPGSSPIRVSPSGGGEPIWSARGDELYYRDNSQLMAVPVTLGERFEFGAPSAIFEARYAWTETPSYDVAPDGRFLMLKPAGAVARSPIHVVLNWAGLLRSKGSGF